MIQLVDFPELGTLMMEPNWADTNPGEHIALAFHFPAKPLTSDSIKRVRNWINRQPVPIIGVALGDQHCGLENVVDVLVTDEDAANAVLDGISRNPQASAVLVQVVRSTPTLPVPQALAVESLAYSTLQGGDEFASWLKGEARHHADKKQAPITRPPVQIDRIHNQLSIVLDTPDNRNALSVHMRDALTDVFKMVAMDASIEQVLVSGNGPSFSAGGDLTEFGESRDRALAHQVRQMRMPAQYLAQAADRYTFYLHGACIGAGVEMPAFASRLVARPDTFFQLPEVGMGLVPGAGGCVSIPRRIGRQNMNYLAITGQRLSAEQALEWHLIDEILEAFTPPDVFIDKHGNRRLR